MVSCLITKQERELNSRDINSRVPLNQGKCHYGKHCKFSHLCMVEGCNMPHPQLQQSSDVTASVRVPVSAPLSPAPRQGNLLVQSLTPPPY